MDFLFDKTEYSIDQVLREESTNTRSYFLNVIVAIVVALLGGALIDNTIKCMQKNQYDKFSAVWYFVVQVAILVVIIFVIMRCNSKFAPWLQGTMSGLVFSVLFFAVQTNLITNSLKITQ